MSSANDMKDFIPCYNCSGLFDKANVYTLTYQNIVSTFCSLFCLTQYAMNELNSHLKQLDALAKVLAGSK